MIYISHYLRECSTCDVHLLHTLSETKEKECSCRTLDTRGLIQNFGQHIQHTLKQPYSRNWNAGYNTDWISWKQWRCLNISEKNIWQWWPWTSGNTKQADDAQNQPRALCNGLADFDDFLLKIWYTIVYNYGNAKHMFPWFKHNRNIVFIESLNALIEQFCNI